MCCRCRSTRSRKSGWKRSPARSPMARRRRALPHSRQAAPRSHRPAQDNRAGAADRRRPRLRRRARQYDRDRRSRRLGESLRAIDSDGRRRQARHLRRRRQEARSGAAGVARTARGRARAGRHRGAAGGRALRHPRRQGRRLHALPVLRFRLPDRRAVRRSGEADAALRRRRRAMRAVQGDLPGEVIASAADRFPRRDRASRVIKQEEPFLCIRCGRPFGVKSSVERVVAKLEGKHWMFRASSAARRGQDVRRLPRGGDGGGEFRSFGAPRARPAHHRRLSARARSKAT